MLLKTLYLLLPRKIKRHNKQISCHIFLPNNWTLWDDHHSILLLPALAEDVIFLVASVCLCVCLSVCALQTEPKFGACIQAIISRIYRIRAIIRIRPLITGTRTNTNKQTDKQTDGRYQVHYLPASRSINIIKGCPYIGRCTFNGEFTVITEVPLILRWQHLKYTENKKLVVLSCT